MGKKLTEEEIDAIVMAEANDEDAWEFEAIVKPKAISLRLDTALITKLKALSKLHGKRGYQTMLKEWITEKVEQETHILREVQAKAEILNWEELTS